MSALDRIRSSLAGLAWQERAQADGLPCVVVHARDLHAACAKLRDECGFSTNTFVTAIDRFPSEPRFEICYQFHSLVHGDRVAVRVPVPSSDPRVDSIVDLWPGAAYSERCCFDMFGIYFAGHAGLKRLYMPDGYDHFPLRKDFPHQGIEPDRLYREWDKRRKERHGEHAAP